MKILIADDDASFRHLVEGLLGRWGYEVVVAQDGNEAWQALDAKEPPQLALLDWRMPGINGLDLCRRIRKEPGKRYTYIILLTAQHRDQDLVTGMEAGADDYIFKPLDVDILKVRINAGKRMIEAQDELAARAFDLEAANRDLERFSYAVSNDLLKSLMSIGDNAKAIQQLVCREDEECRKFTKRIYDKTKKLAKLIGVMHDFFRPTRSILRPEPLNLSQLAYQTAEHLRKSKPERRVTFSIADDLKVNADKDLLQTALHNLLENAWKHTSHRESAVIEFGSAEVEGMRAYFVRDNGSGFDMEDAEGLFKPFHSLPGTDEFAGRGIGLATVERIIRRHGGKVWAEGEVGKGATFYFTLP